MTIKYFDAVVSQPVRLECEDMGEVRGELITRFAVNFSPLFPKMPVGPRLEDYSVVPVGTDPRAREEADRVVLQRMGISPDTVRDAEGELVIA
jgi:hypothetical protein